MDKFLTLVNNARGRLFLVMAFLCVGFASSGQTEVAQFETPSVPSAVGYASLVLGEAYVSSGQNRSKVSVGDSINVGDRIYTESNGHVHIRFVDEALVSVRPRSTLEVQRYEFDPRQPQNSAVKFHLIEGVTRSISGGAAKAARHRFRLNTPVAAIGVRGTDFVVSASSRATRAQVNEGSIVMAPFSCMCSSDALGPCSQNAVELAGDTFQVIEISASNLLPQAESEQPQNLIVDLQDRFRLAGQGRVLGPRESDEKDAASAYLEVAASGKVAEASFSSDSSVVAQGVVRDFTPTLPFSVADVADNQLVWGRFGVGRGVSERLSVERLVAAEARSITIAASDYLLYRTEVSGARVKANSGIVGFKLDSAQAFYNAGGGDVSLSVTDGVLDVNFVANSFSTALNFDHPNIGELRFSGTGRIADGGYLIGLQEKQSVLGAVATDGSEAGYFFEQQLDAGFISGLTLWGGR